MSASPANWYANFKAWIGRPSPTGQWVYRGQAARHSSILPKLLRDPYRKFYRIRLYDIDYGLARAMLSASPVFHSAGLYADLISGEEGLNFERFTYGILGVPPRADARLSLDEIIRALAQHYDYPTLFVDISLDPIVAAFFATHAYNKGTYAIRVDEGSFVYRWPAVRVSRSRLWIARTSDPHDIAAGSGAIDVIDISHINRFMRRPRNQHAVLAAPVIDPKPLYQPFPSSTEVLQPTDMAKLPCCERFELPHGAGSTLTELEGVTPEALVPDRIDLGYSYLTLIALLSLCIHDPTSLWPRPNKGQNDDELKRQYQFGLAAGRAILDRECLRLVEGCPIPDSLRNSTLLEASLAIDHCVEVGRGSAGMLKDNSILAESEAWRQLREAGINEEAKKRFDLLKQAIVSKPEPDRSDFDPSGAAPFYRVPMDYKTDWVLPELARREQR